MSSRCAPLALLVLLVTAAAQAAEPPALSRARALYNSADFDGAIAAAAEAQRLPDASDAAALVLARSHLERYRRSLNPADLSSARDALGLVRLAALTPRDQVDLFVGLGQSLYLENMFGAAAELFDTALSRGALLDHGDRLMLVDWWATALDRDAQAMAADRRPAVYGRIAARMEEELRQDSGSSPANYWLVVAARGTGDIERAWGAAVAAWVRSTLARPGAESLRADLDRLVTQALIPERAQIRSPSVTPELLTMLGAEWDMVKSQWK